MPRETDSSEQTTDTTTDTGQQATERQAPDSFGDGMLAAVSKAVDSGGAGEDNAGASDAHPTDGDAPSAPAASVTAGADGAEPGTPPADDAGTEPGPDDDLTAPLPDDVSDGTRKRFERLAGGYRELREQHDAATAQLDDMRELFRSTGADADAIQGSFSYLTLRNSDSRADQERAYEMAMAEARGLAERLGKPWGADDTADEELLAKYPDLVEDVRTLDVSRERALELARLRRAGEVQEADRSRRRQAEQSQVEQRQQFQQRAQAGGQAVDAVIAELQRDPDFAAKAPVLREQMEEIARTYDPERWGDEVRRVYRLIGVGAPARQPGGRSTQPLSGGGGVGRTAAPKSMYEAISNAVDSAGS